MEHDVKWWGHDPHVRVTYLDTGQVGAEAVYSVEGLYQRFKARLVEEGVVPLGDGQPEPVESLDKGNWRPLRGWGRTFYYDSDRLLVLERGGPGETHLRAALILLRAQMVTGRSVHDPKKEGWVVGPLDWEALMRLEKAVGL